MNHHDLQRHIAPLKDALLEHPLYGQIDSVPALHVFMQHHVFAVWDFMSLLKELQRRLSCVEVPWLPSKSSVGSRLINEIVLAEESDYDGQGGFASHLQLYHRAMTKCGASTVLIDQFLNELRTGKSVVSALESIPVPESVRCFVRYTFRVIEEGHICAIASSFTFGREDILPAMFRRVVDELNVKASGGLEEFRYYLNRHIGLDEDEHGPMAGKLLTLLCGSEEERWLEAQRAAERSLKTRKDLWDGMLAAIRQGKEAGNRPCDPPSYLSTSCGATRAL